MDKQKRIDKRKFKAEKYKKFIGSRQEGQGFADKRKKKIQYEYLKMMKKEKRQKEKSASFLPHDVENKEKPVDKDEKKTKQDDSNTYSKSQKQFSKKKQEKEKKKKETLQKKREVESALTHYKNKKSKQYKLLCKRTYKGQPVMKNQIELLLHKIQSGVNQT